MIQKSRKSSSISNNRMNNMNNKEKDREMVLSYIKEHGRASVDELKEKSGAEPLRVDVIVFEEVCNGQLEVEERGQLGSIESVVWKG